MKRQIHDFDDYSEFMAKQLRTLRHFERCLFCVWCAERVLALHADLLSGSLSESDLRTLQDVLNEMWDSLLNGIISEKDQLNALDMEFMGNSDGWDAPMRENHPIHLS